MRSTTHIAISDGERNDRATSGVIKECVMGLVKTRRLAAMHKQQRAKAGMTLRVTLASTNGWPLTETQAHLYHIVCLPSSCPSVGYWRYNVETSGTLIDCLTAGVERRI